MDENPQPAKLGYYLDILSRRRWYIIIPFFVVMGIGLYYAITLPRIYSATTLLFHKPPEVPNEYIRSIESTEIATKIDHISNEITSKDNLEKIIRQFNLDLDRGQSYINAMVENLRNRVEVGLLEEVIAGDRTTDTFYISFKGKEPEKVMHITNALAVLFIENRLNAKKDMAMDTTDFLEEEILTTRRELEKHDQKIKDFREEHMGGLPEQLQNNLRAIERLESQRVVKQEHILDAKNRLVLLNNQLAEIRVQQQNAYLVGAEDGLEMNPIAKLQRMKSELEDLEGRYTPQHPDIVRLKVMIKELEQKIEAGDLELPEAMKHSFSPEQLDQLSPLLVEQRRSLLRQISAIKLEIKTLNLETIEIEKDIANYQRHVDETPLKEQELSLLRRDYNRIKINYEGLLDRKMQAQLAVSLEEKNKGEQFRILRRAWLPQKPDSPKLKVLFLLTFIIAINLGAGLVFLLEYFDTSVRQVTDLESDIGIPVLVTIPELYTAGVKVKHRLNSVLTFASMAFAVAIFAAFVVLVVNGLEGTIELINELTARSS